MNVCVKPRSPSPEMELARSLSLQDCLDHDSLTFACLDSPHACFCSVVATLSSLKLLRCIPLLLRLISSASNGGFCYFYFFVCLYLFICLISDMFAFLVTFLTACLSMWLPSLPVCRPSCVLSQFIFLLADWHSYTTIYHSYYLAIHLSILLSTYSLTFDLLFEMDAVSTLTLHGLILFSFSLSSPSGLHLLSSGVFLFPVFKIECFCSKLYL